MLLLKTKSFIGGNGGRVGQPVITSDGTIIYSDAGGTVRAVILDDTSTTPSTTTTTTTTTIYVQQIIEIF